MASFVRSLVVLVTAAFVFGIPSATIASPAATWTLAMASKVEAGAQSRSTYIVQAWATLPNACYNSRIERQVGTNINLPQYYVQQTLITTGLCSMMKSKMVVHCTPRLVITPELPKSILVASLGSTPTKPRIWKVSVATTPPTGYIACPYHKT